MPQSLGMIDFLVACTKDGSAGMLRGKVTACVIFGGIANWTLWCHGVFEETGTIDTLIVDFKIGASLTIRESSACRTWNRPRLELTWASCAKSSKLAGTNSNWQTSWLRCTALRAQLSAHIER